LPLPAQRVAGDAAGTAARFAVTAIQTGIPLNPVQRLLPHAQITTTAGG